MKDNSKSPKRRKDKYNPYTITQYNGCYFLSFKDSEGKLQSLVINKSLYDLFNEFELEDLSWLNVWDRHIEHSELTEESLGLRALKEHVSVEDSVTRNIQTKQLHKAISQLPEIQRRRLVLYFFMGLTYEQIAEMEGCTKRAVKASVDIALDKLKVFLRNF